MSYSTVMESVNEFTETWQPILGLGHFTIETVFLDSYYGDDGEEDFKVTAVTESRWQYLQARIKWYLPSAARHGRDEIERIVVHELTHVLLAPEQTLIDSRLEQAAEDEAMTDSEYGQLQAAWYDRLELATEMVTRALIGAAAR